MIKHFLISVFFTLIFCNAGAQFDTIFAKSRIRHCADSLVTGFKTRNWELFTRYSYPALIGSIGGRSEFIKYMEKMFAPIPDSAWKKYETGRILQVIKTGGDLQTVIELNTILDWQGKRITNVAHLIGESWDGGMIWTFFDSGGNRDYALVVKPDLSDELIIPPNKEKTEAVPSPPVIKQNP